MHMKASHEIMLSDFLKRKTSHICTVVINELPVHFYITVIKLKVLSPFIQVPLAHINYHMTEQEQNLIESKCSRF